MKIILSGEFVISCNFPVEISSSCIYLQCVDVVVHPDESSDEKLIEDQPVMTKDILDLRELRIRIKAVEKVVEERNKPILEVSSYNKCGRDSAESEIEALKSRRSSDLEKHEHAERRSLRNEHGDGHNRQKMKPKSFDGRNRIPNERYTT